MKRYYKTFNNELTPFEARLDFENSRSRRYKIA